MTTPVPLIEPLVIPGSLHGPGGERFIGFSDLCDAVQRGIWGNDDFCLDPERRLEAYRHDDYEERHVFLARSDGRLVGCAVLDVPLADNLSTCYLDILVHPGHRRQGVAKVLHATAENHVRRLGRTVIMGWSEMRLPAIPDPEVLVPGSGAGGYPKHSAAASFALSEEYDLAQVDRISLLPPSTAGLPAHDTDGADGYGMVFWENRVPDGLIDRYAVLRRFMSTDAPLGDFVLEEEVWDAERIRADEERHVAGGGLSLVCAAVEKGSGALVGHTVLHSSRKAPFVAYQEDTLVLRGHRGHRLGYRMKAPNLRRLRDEWPAVERLYTWNAAENSFMLAVNVELGFRPVGATAGWQKKLR
ncbi:GNAT family N-acetyltransferase [Arthrobacter sp. Br18]|uniref:GNAT family N-acetyltransferase n=1 Tax=Arthrobacter sp. Br18 TaxID=1312954 RepID=UPI00047CF7D4|nr:GNAT family N-acetyltransferase [Arthrobacter sp. Br18]